MTKLEALAKDCIENHTHKLVDKPTKQDIYLREESIFIQGYRQSEKRIAELEKENAELKKKLKPENCLKLLAKEGYIKFTSEQLTKAKEIIKGVMNWYWETDICSDTMPQELRQKAEQFLNSEVEK